MFWLSDAEGFFLPEVRESVLGSHVAAPCQADPSFTAYPHALAARSLGGTPQLTTSGESYRASPACVRTAGANSISSFSSNDSLGRPHLLAQSPLACRVFLIKKTLFLQITGQLSRGW